MLMTEEKKPAMLANVTKGRKVKPPRILLYGTEGVGKSTFASTMLSPIFIDLEDGLGNLDVVKFPIAKTWQAVLDQLSELEKQPHEYRTVVVDSLDWLEVLIWADLCEREGVDSMEKACGGFQKAYLVAKTVYWQKFTERLDALRLKGMSVCVIAHYGMATIKDPEGPEYQQKGPRLHKWACAHLCEWADAVLFAHQDYVTRKVEGASKDKPRHVATEIGPEGGNRVLRCVGSPAVVAKNRYGMPWEIPLTDWQGVRSYIVSGS